MRESTRERKWKREGFGLVCAGAKQSVQVVGQYCGKGRTTCLRGFLGAGQLEQRSPGCVRRNFSRAETVVRGVKSPGVRDEG